MSAIVEFLRARLDEQTSAAAVLAADDGHDVNCGSNHNLLIARIGHGAYFEVDSNDLRRDAAAKRALVNIMVEFLDDEHGLPDAWGEDGELYVTMLRHFASVYSGHPDYRSEWAPESGE